MTTMNKTPRSLIALLLVSFALFAGAAHAAIDGLTGTTFNLTAKTGYISTGDGNSLLVWGYANGDGLMQYPGPTLIVNQGDTITVNLTNTLTVPVSIVFPGQTGVTATGGTPGLMTAEAAPGATVSYSFTAAQAGTYLYQSGTQPHLQIEMGLVGALIVRPNVASAAMQAYEHQDTMFDREDLFLLTEMDARVHELVDMGRMADVDNAAYFPTLWFINGRNAPDTMAEAFVSWLPHQPYNSMPRMHPGERLLMRLIGAGRDLHPFHTHGNHALVIARDGRLLSSAPGAGADLANPEYTITVAPGQTVDAIFEWTGKDLGWDIYGHQAGDALEPNEYAPDHGKPLPVALPNQQDLTFGGYWGGSPFLGLLEPLPPGEGGMNPYAGFTYMWHSHTEKEMTNDDIFPGGMMTMLIIEHPSVHISH